MSGCTKSYMLFVNVGWSWHMATTLFIHNDNLCKVGKKITKSDNNVTKCNEQLGLVNPKRQYTTQEEEDNMILQR